MFRSPRPAPRRSSIPAALICVAAGWGAVGCDSDRSGVIEADPATVEERRLADEAYSAEQERLAREGYEDDD